MPLLEQAVIFGVKESIRLRPVFEKTSFECDDLFFSSPERLLP